MKKSLLTLLLVLLIITVGFNQSVTNVGTDFWIAFPANYTTTATLKIFISSNFSTIGTVYSAYPGVNQNFNVTPGLVTQLSVPSGVGLTSGIEDKGIRITSNDPICVYGLNEYAATTDAYMALPINALGLDYRILTFTTSLLSYGSAFSVVATQDGTSLTIFNHQTNSTSNINLNQGQTYYVEAPAIGNDVTGSRIQSNYPVAVYGSVETVQIPNGTCSAADHIVEEMFPCYSWGKNFVTVPLAGRDASGDVFRILAAEDGTDITINGTLVSTINTGAYYQTILTGSSAISTSKATLLAQYAKGMMCSGLTGDPLMMLIPPKEQFLTNYTVVNVALATPTTHWINVVAPDYALGTIYQDGVLIPNVAFTQIGTTNYYGAQRSVLVGSHTFNSTFPFGVFVYGWASAESYGYPGGGSLSPVGTVNSVTLAPDTSYGQLNVTNVCLTATVKDNFANPVVGVLVNFYVSGINPLTGNAFTDALGHAQYCYTQTGVTPGTDHVYAEIFGFKSDTSVVIWSYLSPCTNPATGGTIGNNQSGCGNYTPSPITSITNPTGQTGTLEYKWQFSITGSSSGFTDIPSSNTSSFTPGTITQTTWFKRVARVNCMTSWSGSVESNVVEMIVITPLPVSVSISAFNNNVCAGTQVTFTALPANEGTTPVYQWKVNGTNTGTNSTIFSYTPVNGDIVTCTLNSSEVCTSNNPAISNSISMIVNDVLVVGCTISASTNPVCEGTTVTFNATPANGGTSPTYQWKVNGINKGINSPTFAFIPVNGDQVICLLTSGLSCTPNNPATSNSIIMTVNALPVVTFTRCFDSVTVTNAKPIKLKGGIPLGGTYSGTGVSAGYYYPSIAGAGTHLITYTYTNMALCSASKTSPIHQFTSSPFSCGTNLTDIRDNKKYPTAKIGSQCWMAANLDFGLQISDLTHQRDNCIPETYIRNASPVTHYAYYQWDEIMQYDDTPGSKGMCPPAWHVPTEAEWNALFANWTNNGFAGTPLKYNGFSGFNALLAGVEHFNSQWDFNDFATFFWSSKSQGENKAWAFGMNEYNPSVSSYPSSRNNAFSVRCLKDN